MVGKDRLDRVLNATATVSVGGRRTGSAVLVASRHLLTAGHTLGSVGPDSTVDIEFPGQADPLPVTVVPLAADHGLDLAVLELDRDVDREPILLSASRRLPDTVHVVGFPHAEYQAKGVWRRFQVSGPSTEGTVQLDWVTQGTFVGQSGGPVADDADATLVGILVEGSETGQFDRFLPLGAIERVWPGLPRGWLFAGEDARGHAERRASGRRGLISGGDLFQGRQQAVDALRNWLTSEESMGRVLVVIGQPGAGKSAVICRSALEAERSGSLGVFFHARQATAAEFFDALAQVLGLPDQDGNPDGLLAAMANLKPSGPPLKVVVDALDESASKQDRGVIAAALTEIARLPWIRVAVATRRLSAVWDSNRTSPLLASLGVHSVDASWLVNLDADPYRDQRALMLFAQTLLSQDGYENPGPPGAAWSFYRQHPSVCRRLASLIASRADGNFLVAALTAQLVSESDDVLDPAHPDFRPKDLPSTVGEAFEKYYSRLTDSGQGTVRALLVALAYARGDGVGDQLWLRFGHALGYPQLSQFDIDALRGSPAGDYLLTTTVEATGRVTRLFHQALVDEIRADRDNVQDEDLIFWELYSGASAGWSDHPYELQFAAYHALEANQLDYLLQDVDYLVAVNIPRLFAVIDAHPQPDKPSVSKALRRCGFRLSEVPVEQRVALLGVSAAHSGLDNARRLFSPLKATNPRNDSNIRINWAHELGPADPVTRRSGPSIVTALALGTDEDGVQMLARAKGDGFLTVWDTTSGERLNMIAADRERVKSIAFGVSADDELLLATGGAGGSVRIWDPVSGRRLMEITPFRAGPVESLDFARAPWGGTLLAAGSWDAVRIWELGSGRLLHCLAIPKPTRATVLGLNAEGRLCIAAASWDGKVHVWDAGSGESLDELTAPQTGLHEALAVGVTPGGGSLVMYRWRRRDCQYLGSGYGRPA